MLNPATPIVAPTGAKIFENLGGHIRKRSNERTEHMKPPPNIVKFRLNGFALDALDQKRMRRLRKTSDRMGVPIPDLIHEILRKMIDALIAEAELPNKIVKFPAAAR
jgi:hypothetical protein